MPKSKLLTCFDNTKQLFLPVDVKRLSLTLLLTHISLFSTLVDIGSHKEEWDLFGLTGSLALPSEDFSDFLQLNHIRPAY